MASPKTSDLCFLAFMLLVYALDNGICKRISLPPKCNIDGERFKPGHQYSYRYEVTVTAGLTETASATAESRLTCLVVVTVPRKCELILKVQNCKLHDRISKQAFVINENSQKLATELKKNPVYLQYSEGEVINHQIVVFNTEPLHIINIKRGIISVLQMKVVSSMKSLRSQLSLHDVFGVCQAHMSVSQESDQQIIETYRDLLSCNLSHISKSQPGYLSFIKSVTGGIRSSPINELTYPFKMETKCNYSVMPSLTIKTAQCVQSQVYYPLLSGSDIQEAPTTWISQHIKLEADTPLLSQEVNHSLGGKRWVDLAMEFTESDTKAYSAQEVLENLEQTVIDFLGQGNTNISAGGFPAESFRVMVDTMRETKERELRSVRGRVLSCHTLSCHTQMHKSIDPKMLQSIEERLFHNGLMSCGTDSCLAVLADCIRDDLLPDFEANSIIFNMGLFYQPSIKIIHIIYKHCRSKDSPTCWLSLSAMIHRVANITLQDEKVARIIFEIISYLHQMIGDKCEHGLQDILISDKDKAMDNLLLVIKAVTNIGQVVQNMYNKKVDESKSLTFTLLNCVKNEHLKLIIKRSAMQAVKSIGLEPHTVSELLDMVEDEKRPVAFRIAIFDVLVMHEDNATLWSLVKLLNTTKMENLKTYIVTRFSGILESQQPELEELKVKLRKSLQGRVLSQPGDNFLYKSYYLQFSQHFTIPLTVLQMGACLAIKMVYTPVSNLFHTLTFESGWIIDNKTVHLFDVTVDLEGMDTLLDMIIKKRNAHQNQTALNFLDILNELKKLAQEASEVKVPPFAQYSDRLKLILSKIFNIANIPREPLPFVHLSMKVFGYEVGSVSLNSLLMMIKQMHLEGGHTKDILNAVIQGMQTMLLRAFMLTDSHKILPTVSGFPLETRTSSSVVTKTFMVVKTALRGSSSTCVHTDLVLRPSVSAMFETSMKVSVIDYITSGMTMKAVGAAMGNWTGWIEYKNLKKNFDWEHDIHGIWDVRNKLFSFLNIRSDIRLVQNGEEHELSPPISEQQLRICLPGIYSQLFGHRICLLGTSHSSFWPKIDPSSLLMSPFRMEGIITLTNNDLNQFSLHVKCHKKMSQPQGFYIEAKFEGRGTELSRQVLLTVDRDYEAGGLEVMVHVPDAGIIYTLGCVSFTRTASYHHKFASVLSRHGKALSSLIFEIQGSRVAKAVSLLSNTLMEYNKTRKNVHLNISFGDLSVDFTYRDFLPVPTYWVTDFAVSYHCKPNLKMLYVLHPDPSLAEAQGHTSTFSCYQETHDSKTSFSETWKGSNTMAITLPGHNITVFTDMVADLRGAQRVTNVNWQHRNETDVIHMNSSVHNQSTAALFNFDYFLHLSCKDKFELDIEGHVRGPRSNPFAMLNISTDITYAVTKQTNEKSKYVLSLILPPGLKETSQKTDSVNKSAKSKLSSPWDDEEHTFQQSTRTNTTDLVDSTQAEKLKKRPFWENLNWSIAIDTQIQVLPHKTSEPQGRNRSTGTHIQWFLQVTAPRGENQVLQVNGSIFRGKENWMKLSFEDYMDETKFNWQAEHYHTPSVFHHHHNWTLEETSKHSFDRSFNLRVHFEHYKQLEYDLILFSPWTNVTHHINYTKISQTNQTVRAYAKVHSLQPAFDLIYHESSDVNNQDVFTHINLTSTILDYQFDLTKLANAKGITVKGQLHFDSKLEILRGERTLLMLLLLPNQRPPVCEWIYRSDESGIKVVMSMLGPSKVKMEVRTISPDEVLGDLFSWTLELAESGHLRHMIEFSPEMKSQIQQAGKGLRKIALHTIKQSVDLFLHNIQSDFKDIIVPFIHKSTDEFLKTRLQQAMAKDPKSRMTKLLMLALGGVDTINTIWADAALVKLIKASHLDRALASTVRSFGDILSDWIIHPPLFFNQLAKIYVQPVLHQSMKSRSITFSTPLVVTASAFNKMPRLTTLQRTVLDIIKHYQVKKIQTVNKEIAVILDGQRIKTFDGYMFDIVEPPRSSCTYLLGADFRNGQFGLTYTGEGLTVFSSRYGFMVTRGGSVFVNDEHISYLPYTSPDGQFSVSLHDGQIQLDFLRELVHVTFNQASDFYLVEIDRSLRNVSLGLLGTNNHESGDDFHLPDGTQISEGGNFQNFYELTNSEKCQVALHPSGTRCNRSDFPACMHLSSDTWQPVAPCTAVLNPKPFMLACQKAECKDKSGCSAVHAYLTACKHQGVKVTMPDKCVSPRDQKSSFDVVIVQSLHHSVIREQDPLHTTRTLIASFGQRNFSFGLVTYGGKGQWENPRAHFVNGKLLEKGTKFAQNMHITVQPDEVEQEADSAILAATHYPFRPQATRVILLVHQRKKRPLRFITHLTEALKASGITLVSASTYPELDSHELRGLFSSKDVLLQGGKMSAPQDIYSTVVMATSGFWLDLDMVSSLEASGTNMNDVVEAFSKLVSVTDQSLSQ